MWLNVSAIGSRSLACGNSTCQSVHRDYWGVGNPLELSGNMACAHIPIIEENGTWYAKVRTANDCGCGCGVLVLRPYADTSPNLASVDNRRQFMCDYCTDFHLSAEVNLFRDTENEDNVHAFCNVCIGHQVHACVRCNERMLNAQLNSVRLSGYGNGNNYQHVCHSCIQDYEDCTHCSRMYLSEEGETCCEEVDSDDCHCSACRYAVRDRERVIKNYSYKPEPQFRAVGTELLTRRHPVYGNDYDATPYLGFELEVEVSRDTSRSRVAKSVQEALGDVAYLKEDGSISHGFEIVTHPMTLDYAMQQFNWRTIRDHRRSKDIMSSDNCGLHVHVSKAGFSGTSHEYRWLLFWHRNQKVLIQLAGRDSNYARYNNAQRGTLRRVAEGKPTDGIRYSAINTTNEATYEVRVFASTLYVNRLKSALQLVDATVEYTRQLAAAKVLKDGGFAWSEFVIWLRTNVRRYPDLITRIRDVVTITNTTPMVSFENVVIPNAYGYSNTTAPRNVVIQEKVSL